MELQLQISWKCGYCKNKNFESSTYCSSCFIPFEHQHQILKNELHKKKILLYWSDTFIMELPYKIHKIIWLFFEEKQAIKELSQPQRLKFGSFYSAGAYYKQYCDGNKWHKSLGECDVDKYTNVNVYDCTSNKKDGHILFHFGFLKEIYKNGDYSFDYETKGVYYYVKDGTVGNTCCQSPTTKQLFLSILIEKIAFYTKLKSFCLVQNAWIMSKKKNAKSAKKTNVAEICATKTRMQVILQEYVNTESLTLSQQKLIVSSLSLSNHSLYDSMVVDIITDFLTFAKKIKLTPLQTESIYRIFQSALYKIMNDKDLHLTQLTSYLKKQFSLRIKAETVMNNDESHETAQDISSQLSEKLIQFIEERILSHFELYRIALFESNPSNIEYIEFKKQFEIDDIVTFQDKNCLFQIQEFRSNYIVLNCLHSDFKSLDIQNENDTNNTVKYNISRDQLRFLSFVSKPCLCVFDEYNQQKAVLVDVDGKESNVINENEDTTKRDEEVEKANVDGEESKNSDKNEGEFGEDAPKTLIDIIVDRKINDKLKRMQQKFDQELEQYKQQIKQLKNR